MDKEVRIVDAETGGEKGSKLAQLGAVDPLSLLEVAQVAGFGAQKYDRYNFLKTYDWSLSFDAMQRHLLAFWSGEDNDPESGLPHVAHATWHGLTLLSFMRVGRAKDNRPFTASEDEGETFTDPDENDPPEKFNLMDFIKEQSETLREYLQDPNVKQSFEWEKRHGNS